MRLTALRRLDEPLQSVLQNYERALPNAETDHSACQNGHQSTPNWKRRYTNSHRKSSWTQLSNAIKGFFHLPLTSFLKNVTKIWENIVLRERIATDVTCSIGKNWRGTWRKRLRLEDLKKDKLTVFLARKGTIDGDLVVRWATGTRNTWAVTKLFRWASISRILLNIWQQMSLKLQPLPDVPDLIHETVWGSSLFDFLQA